MTPPAVVARAVAGVLLAAATLGACSSRMSAGDAAYNAARSTDGRVEAVSLFGQPLFAPELAPATKARYEQNLAAAKAESDRDPSNADATIWLGRRTAYLGRYRESIEIFSRGIAQHPRDARLYRHRGHRYITVREFDKAIADLSKAAELIKGMPDETEPDGIPNARNTPTSTLQFNIWYHLGLAHYLKFDFENAAKAYRECMKVSTNPDALVATSHWMYMTERRLHHADAAAAVLARITPGMDVFENQSYYRLLKLYKGELPVDSLLKRDASSDNPALDDVTVGYGVGNWHYYNDRRAEAAEVYGRVVRSPQWGGFGYIAAEADLQRMERAQSVIRDKRGR
jgi:tetratricopeptide (TPR) repeat protein